MSIVLDIIKIVLSIAIIVCIIKMERDKKRRR